MYKYIKSAEEVREVLEIDQVVFVDDISEYNPFYDVYATVYTDFTEEQLLSMTTEEVRSLDIDADFDILKDIALISKESRNRLSAMQLKQVNAFFDTKDFKKGLYKVDLQSLVNKLNSVEYYKLMNDVRKDDGRKNKAFLTILEHDPDAVFDPTNNSQILYVLKNLKYEDFEHRVISISDNTYGSYIYVAKPWKNLSFNKNIDKKLINSNEFGEVRLFFRVLDGYEQENSSIVLISCHLDNQNF